MQSRQVFSLNSSTNNFSQHFLIRKPKKILHRSIKTENCPEIVQKLVSKNPAPVSDQAQMITKKSQIMQARPKTRECCLYFDQDQVKKEVQNKLFFQVIRRKEYNLNRFATKNKPKPKLNRKTSSSIEKGAAKLMVSVMPFWIKNKVHANNYWRIKTEPQQNYSNSKQQ